MGIVNWYGIGTFGVYQRRVGLVNQVFICLDSLCGDPVRAI